MFIIICTTAFLTLLAVFLAVYVLLIANDVPAVVFFTPDDLKLRLNFTDADRECRLRFPPFGRLFVPENADEENRFISDLKDQPDAYLRACPRIFIGLRVRMMEKLNTPKSFVLPLEFESRETKEEIPTLQNGTDCVVNEYNATGNTNSLATVPCIKGQYKCAMCEVIPRIAYNHTNFSPNDTCPRHYRICYALWHTKIPRAFNYMPALCKEIGGRLAFLGSLQLTDYQAKSLATKECAAQPVAALVANGTVNVELETITGRSVDYGIQNLEPGAGIENCISATTDTNYPLKYSPCFDAHCFACQITKSSKVGMNV